MSGQRQALHQAVFSQVSDHDHLKADSIVISEVEPAVRGPQDAEDAASMPRGDWHRRMSNVKPHDRHVLVAVSRPR